MAHADDASVRESSPNRGDSRAPAGALYQRSAATKIAPLLALEARRFPAICLQRLWQPIVPVRRLWNARANIIYQTFRPRAADCLSAVVFSLSTFRAHWPPARGFLGCVAALKGARAFCSQRGGNLAIDSVARRPNRALAASTQENMNQRVGARMLNPSAGGKPMISAPTPKSRTFCQQISPDLLGQFCTLVLYVLYSTWQLLYVADRSCRQNITARFASLKRDDVSLLLCIGLDGSSPATNLGESWRVGWAFRR